MRIVSRLVVVAAVAVISVCPLVGSAPAHATPPSPACTVRSNPSQVETGSGPSEASSIADIIEVACQPIYSGSTVTIDATPLSDACQGTLSWASPPLPPSATGAQFTVTLDSDGNAIAAVWGGPSCAPSTDRISASLNVPPFTGATTLFRILAPANTTPGLTATPKTEIEDGVFSAVATVFQVAVPSDQANQFVTLTSNDLFSRCAGQLSWYGPQEVLLGTNVDQVTVQVDNNGNAFVVAIAGPSCASGSSTVTAALTTVPYTTYVDHFKILSPRPAWWIPAPPTAVSAAAGDASASVSWTAPADNGSDISSYTVTGSPDGASVTVPGSQQSATVSGLTNGVSEAFTVVATNAVGPSAPSAPSNSVTPAGVPGGPSAVSAAAGDASASVSWTAPADNGSGISSYTVTGSPDGASVTVPGSQQSATVSGLTNGVSEAFTVVATNAVGPSAPSAPSNSVTPAGVPGGPSAVSAAAGDASASVSWTAPADNGSGISSYTVTGSPDGASVTVPGSQQSATVSGLTNGVSEAFTVVATNAVGPSAPSAPSNSVTPAAVTTLSLSASTNPAIPPVTVTYRVVVTPTPNGGSVTFRQSGVVVAGCAAVTVSGGRAVCTTGYRDAGAYSVQAAYSGNAAFLASSSTVVMERVNAAVGYWMVDSTGSVFPFGSAHWYREAQTVGVTHFEPSPSRRGYWIVNSLGQVFAFGDAPALGNAAGLVAGESVSSLSSTPSGRGYWLFTSRGRVLRFGDAQFFGDMSGRVLNGPVVGSIATPSGRGYYLVASDGGIFAFGDARFHGSMGAVRLNQPVNSLVPTADNGGYWLVASDGGVFAFGDARFHGSMGGTRLNRPVVGMVRYGTGYLMVGSDGGIFDFSNQPFLGSLGGIQLTHPIVSVAT